MRVPIGPRVRVFSTMWEAVMNIDQLVSLVTMMLAISLAAERLVTALKSALPKWLAEEQRTNAMTVDTVADGPRRLWVMLAAFVTSYVTSALVANHWGPLDKMAIGPADHSLQLPVVVIALLASGGSAFWNNVLGYAKAVKDIRGQDRDARTLANNAKAAAAGIHLGAAAAARVLPDHAAPVQRAMASLRNASAPKFGARRS